MCGINGFTFNDKEKILKMNQAIEHRGPDDGGVYLDDYLSLGNRRLAIIDLSSQGHQPMLDVSKRFVITYNGEIYNFQGLRAELMKKGYKFKSHSDTEVILNLYREYKEKSLLKLNGMFAFAIWDKKEKELLIARDRFGVKPLYYQVNGQNLAFSSEIKALLLLGKNSEVDLESLDLYLALRYVPAPRTMIRGIQKVLPGQMIIWKNGKLRKKLFWSFSEVNDFFKTKEEAESEIYASLKSSVKHQLISERPVGLLLSGGIDSTITLALANDLLMDKPVETFSIGFSGIPQLTKFNADVELAKKTARYYNTNHHEFFLSPSAALRDFQKLISLMDEPIANPTHIPTYTLSKETAKYVTVLLSGDGGDELFAGYDRYLDAVIFEIYTKIPSAFRKNVFDKVLKRFLGKQNDFLERLASDTLAKKYLVFMGNNLEEVKKIYAGNIDKAQELLTELKGFDQQKPLPEALMRLDFAHWLPEESLMRTDKMCMLHSLEQRVPFLDNQVAEVARRIPLSWNIGIQRRKMLLRKTFAKDLPPFILNEPKRGFFSPGAKWLRDKNWQKYVKDVFSETNLKNPGFFKGKELEKMLKEHIEGTRYNSEILWSVLFFQTWYHNVLKQA